MPYPDINELPPIEPDSDDNFGSSSQSISSTESLDWSNHDVTYHVFENGRRYHRFCEGRYLVPDDREELDRLTTQYHCCTQAFNSSLYLAPLEQLRPKRILDLGTGVGAWAFDIACLFPHARVIGLDLSPTQPSLVPPNLSFQVADIERIPWSFAPGSFDYINCRFLAGAVVSWPALLAQCLTALRPGGYIEFTDVVEWFSNATGGSVMAEWSALWTRGLSEKLKRRVFTTSDGMQEVVRLLAKAGFETPIAQTTADIPVGSWPIDAELKKLGRTWRDAMCGGVEGQVLALLVRSEGWSVADVEVLSGNLRAELKNRQAVSNVRTRIGCCIAKKPA